VYVYRPEDAMQAIVSTEYGSPERLRLEEVDKPALEPDAVLIRVHAASVNPYDWHLIRGEPYVGRLMGMGLRRPSDSRRGADTAGTIDAVGESVTGWEPGDEVFGRCTGAFAEYVLGDPEKLVAKPARLTFEEAAAIPIAGVTALQALRDGGAVQPGQRVLINGAAGGVGTFAVQIAKSLGAHVTGVCSTRNVELVRSIGADDVVDYSVDDFSRAREPYDVILDTVGNRSLRALRRALAPNGTLVVVGGGGGRLFGPITQLARAFVLGRLVRQQVKPFMANIRNADLLLLKELVDDGKVTPVLDRTYPLRETAEAVRYLEGGHVRGKVAITI
jgi:NADPH:quinone reductase-like Zn-dependent oxidoreductase